LVDVGKVDDVEVRKNCVLVARATGDSQYLFRNLDRGTYSVESAGRKDFVDLSGDQFLDLTTESSRRFEETKPAIFDRLDRKLVAAVLILAINVIGALLIFRIIRRG
jgi:hypothetical protein